MNRSLAAFVVAAALLRPVPADTAAPPDGRPVDYPLRTSGGEAASVRDYLGSKPVLLAFWATWCPACKDTIPRLKEIETGLLRDKVKLLAVDYLESREKVASFIRKLNIPYTVLLDRDGTVARRFRVQGVPAYILLDGRGEIAWRGHALPEDIESLLR